MDRYDWGWNQGERGYGMSRGRGYGSDFSERGGAWADQGMHSGEWGEPGRRWTRGDAGYDRGLYGGGYPGFGGYPGGQLRGTHFGGRGYGMDYGQGRGGFTGGGGSAWSGRGGGYGGEYGISSYQTGGYQPGHYGPVEQGGDYGTGGMDRFGGFHQGFGAYGGGGASMGGGYRGGFGGGGGYDQGYAQRPFIPEQAYREHPELNRSQRHLGGRWPERGNMGYHEEVGDDEIRESVEQNLRQDGWLNAAQIEVEVDDRVVTLRGEVGDYMEARYAWDDAWEAMGVRGVVNQLTVRLDEPSTEQHGDPLPQSEGGKRGAARGNRTGK